MASKLKKHKKTEEKEHRQRVVALMMSSGLTQGEVSRRTDVPESTIRQWYATDPGFSDIVLEAAKRAGRKFLPVSMSVIHDFLHNGSERAKKWAVDKVLELNGLTKKGHVTPQINSPAAVTVNMGLDDKPDSVEVTQEDLTKADEILAEVWNEADAEDETA